MSDLKDFPNERYIVTEEKMERALHYLINTDDRCAKLQAKASKLKNGFKAAEALAFIAEEGNATERKAQAPASEICKTQNEQWEDAQADYLLEKNRRDTAQTIIDVWRSKNASQRKS